MRQPLKYAAILALSLAGFARAGDSAFDRIDADLGQYLDHRDPLSFPMKIKSISADEYTFWRGTKDLFYQWCKTNCADWLADRDAYVITHGDLHLGNIGTYATAAWGSTAFGMVDFDESARLPFQIELLQGLITFDLLARQNNILLTSAQHQAVIDALFDSYSTALTSGQSATVLLASDPPIRAMLDKRPADYWKDLSKYVENGHFKRLIGGEKISNILTPLDYAHFDSFAGAIAEAARNDPKLAALLKWQNEPAIRGAIKDVARRVRIGSSGSQGLAKYFVLLNKPFKNYDGDIILYFKREIPSAAERVGAVPMDPRSPGERYAADMARLTDPPALFSSWATIDGGSYWVSFKEPWSDELAYASVEDFDALRDTAIIWGNTTGAAHARAGDGAKLKAQLTPAVRQILLARSAAYAWENSAAFASFTADDRTQHSIKAVAQWTKAVADSR